MGVTETGAIASSVSISAQTRESRPATILLTTTLQLPSTARLALALAKAGCKVALAAAGDHPARHTSAVTQHFDYAPIRQSRALQHAIERSAPDLIMPCDDRALRHLHSLHAATSDLAIRRLLEDSLSAPASFAAAERRHEFLDLAAREGIRIPTTKAVRGLADLRQWAGQEGFPAVVKADGTWAGQGVRIVGSLAEAQEAYRALTKPVSGLRAIRDMLVDRDPFWVMPWLARTRPLISVQRYIDGWPANCGVACWRGQVIAGTYVEVVQAESRTGASSVVRIIDNPDMRQAAERIVAALGLTGLVGFDFMIDAATGSALLIEMNARCTPICPVPLGPGRDLVEALAARVTGRPEMARAPATDLDMLAFFPDLWQQDPGSDYLRTAFHDVPWDEPALLRALLKPEFRDRYWFTRKLRPLWRLLRRVTGDPSWEDPVGGTGLVSRARGAAAVEG
jgi:hypothetical protein